MRKCKLCGTYTLSECACGGEAGPVGPPKYSPHDRYWKERLIAKGVKL